MRIADFIEQQVLVAIEKIVEVIQTVCKDIVETIEVWEQRWEQQCESVKKQVCTWLPWPLDDLCDWVTDTVCKWVQVWFKVIKTVVKTVCETIVSFIKVVVLVPMTIVLVVFRFVCFWVDFIVSWVKIIIAIFVGIPEFLLCLLGLKIRKHLHACVTVLADARGQPVVSSAQVDAVLNDARRIISDRFNVRLHIHGRKIVRVDDDNLDVTACDASQLFSSDAVDLTSEGNQVGTFADIFGCGGSVLDIAGGLLHDVLNIIFIRSIIEGDDVGCHVPGTDYVIIDATASGLVLAHEIGHAGDLWHVSQEDNLMNHFTKGDDVKSWQVCIFRRSRFVVYAP
jgi:hypothetical protein